MKRIMTIVALMMFVVIGANAQGINPIQVFDKPGKAKMTEPLQMLEFDRSTLGNFTNMAEPAAPKAKVTADGWTSVGQETFTDGTITAIFSASPASYKIEVLKNNANPNLYRLVEPFGTSNPYYSTYANYMTYSTGTYIDIDISNPNSVVLTNASTGWTYSSALITFSGTGTISGGVVSFPTLSVNFAGQTTSGSIAIELSDLKWSAWEPFAPGGENYAKYLFTGMGSYTQDSVKVFVRTSTADSNVKQIKVENWGDKWFVNGVDFIIDWNAATDSCTVAAQPTGYYNKNYGSYVYVMDYPTFYSKATYKNYPCTYNRETGVFTLNVGYTLPSYIGSGSGFGSGEEQLRMYGLKDYTISNFHLSDLTENTKTGAAVQKFVVTSPNSTKFRYKMALSSEIKSADDIEVIAKSLTGDYAKDDSFYVNIPGTQGIYYIITASYNDEGTYKDYTSKWFFYSPSTNWNVLGNGTVTDDIVTAYSSKMQNITTPVEIQEHKSYPGLYRLKNAYGKKYYYYSSEGYKREDCYVYVNATNANAVQLANPWLSTSGLLQELGLSFGDGEFSSYQMPNSQSKRTFGWLKNDSITFPVKGLGMATGSGGSIYYANTKGLFCIVLPNTLERKVIDAVKGKKMGDDAVVDLEAGKEYALDGIANAGLVNLIINGNGATVKVGAAGQIAAKVNLAIQDVNFDCADATQPIILMQAMDNTTSDSVLYNKYGANGKNAYFMDNMAFHKVNASELKVPFIGATGSPWALENLLIDECIFQINNASYKTFINMQHGKDGMIKYIDVTNSTFYGTQPASNAYFLIYNTSRPVAEKFYGVDSKDMYWNMTSNTFAQVFQKQFTDRYTENKADTLTWTKNLFYSVGNLTKTRNCFNNFTAADNATDGLNASSNKNYATEDSTAIVVPTTALDFANIMALKANFAPQKQSYSHLKRMGDPRWLSEIFSKTYQYVHKDTVLYMNKNEVLALNALGNVNNEDAENQFSSFLFQKATSTINPETDKDESAVRQGVVVGNDAVKTFTLRIYADKDASVYLYATPFNVADACTITAHLNGGTLCEASSTSGSVVASLQLEEKYNEIQVTAPNDVCLYAAKVVYGKTGSATGIEEVETENANSAVIYNLRGQKVNNMIQGEVYIINGRKFIAK